MKDTVLFVRIMHINVECCCGQFLLWWRC